MSVSTPTIHTHTRIYKPLYFSNNTMDVDTSSPATQEQAGGHPPPDPVSTCEQLWMSGAQNGVHPLFNYNNPSIIYLSIQLLFFQQSIHPVLIYPSNIYSSLHYLSIHLSFNNKHQSTSYETIIIHLPKSHPCVSLCIPPAGLCISLQVNPINCEEYRQKPDQMCWIKLCVQPVSHTHYTSGVRLAACTMVQSGLEGNMI